MDSSPYSSGGMPYYGDGTSTAGGAGGRHSYPHPQQQPPSSFHSSLPNLHAPQQYEQQPTLPPLQSQPRPLPGTSSSLLDHYNRPHQQQPGFPSAAANSLNSYAAGPGAPFGGQFANYSHESLLPQQHQGYQMQHDPASGGYMSDLRNSGFGGLGSSLPPPLPSSQAYGAPFPGPYDNSPGHVVGAQGRRGILPSDDGRPSAVQPDGSTTARTNIMPVKDADGKYPCPHCSKSYLHAKHLKRHLLRHTGDRPYSCFLCNDTFSRSDILKRHFQKCSIRRGNPTGASHLSHSQSHLRKQAVKRTSNDLSKAETKSLPDSETTSIASASTSRPASDNFSSIRSDGRTDSGISTKSSILSRDARSLNGPQPLTPVKPEQGSYSQHPVIPTSPLTSGRNVAYTSGSNGTHGFRLHEQSEREPQQQQQQQEGESDWLALLHRRTAHEQQQQQQQQRPHQPFPPNGAAPNLVSSFYNIEPGTPGPPTVHGSHHSAWQAIQPNTLSYYKVSHRLTSFLDVDNASDIESTSIREMLEPDNIGHFLAKYQNFHIHWPHVHLQTFNPLTSYAGLVLAMVTIGAVYSDRVDLSRVRILMNRTKLHVRNVSDVGKAAKDRTLDVAGLMNNPQAYDEIVSLSLLTTLILWHADPDQRQMLSSDHPDLCDLLRRMDMLKPLPRGHHASSELHQPDFDGAIDFDYGAWIRQEKRSRALYTTVLTDMGQSLYFNTRPNFLAEEIEIPLPADDAAWEACSAQECAIALGLHGLEMQEAANTAGSRRLKQLEFNRAMDKLTTGEQFEARATNAFGRFLLIHGTHIRIWFAQHQRSSSGIPSLEPNVEQEQDQARLELSRLETELQRWRNMSDGEDNLQYPLGAAPRLGFCRDGKTYFWLGKMLIKNTSFLDPNAHWQHRFRTMVQALKQAKAITANETGADGGLLNLSSDNVDPAYGMDDLTLDMKLLFTPLTPQNSPGFGGGTYHQFHQHAEPVR